MADSAEPTKIRLVTPFDVPVIAAVQADCFTDGRAGEAWSEATIARILALPGAFGLLALRERVSPAGVLLGRAAADEAEVLSLGVARCVRRRGVGLALIRAALDRAAEDGASRLFLEVAEDNAPARALYTAAGFSLAGRRRRYYRLSGADALVFVRDVSGVNRVSRVK